MCSYLRVSVSLPENDFSAFITDIGLPSTNTASGVEYVKGYFGKLTQRSTLYSSSRCSTNKGKIKAQTYFLSHHCDLTWLHWHIDF
mgnify:CR=1 FL=1